MTKPYRLNKSRRILKEGYSIYKKKSHLLSETEKISLKEALHQLDEAILVKDRLKADELARQVESQLHKRFPKTFLDHGKELIGALVFAVVIAFAVRQVWFELYEVPTGSMRPTVEELDRLVVSKTTFGINFPFQKGLFLFKPEYLQRNGIVVFTVEDMDVSDADTRYFYFFPGKKRYIKRCLGRPGDTLYFYGGRIYGIDAEGQPITELADEDYLKSLGIERIDHVPYITFEGKTSVSLPLSHGVFGGATFRQMNIPVGKIQTRKQGVMESQFFNGKEWAKDNPALLRKQHNTPVSYSDLWGMGNYAMARILTQDDLSRLYSIDANDGLLYLELRHTPNLTYPHPELRRGENGRVHPSITPFATFIPLEMHHLEAIKKAMITARFFVKNGKAYRYQEGNTRPQHVEFDPSFPNVPNGCYEFYYGQGYKVHRGGIRTKLPENHPLNAFSLELIQKLFNLGFGFNIVFSPIAPNQPYNPQRFAYFRDGDLYLMGALIFSKDDPTLLTFVKQEIEKQVGSTEERPYVAFIDHGPPLNEKGEIDSEFIKAFGLKIPEDGLLALGDNYAMSADSRDFGFVPLMNLRGAPSFTFWPPSKRIGPLPQPGYPWFTLPNILIWTLATIVIVTLIILAWKARKKPIIKR